MRKGQRRFVLHLGPLNGGKSVIYGNVINKSQYDNSVLHNIHFDDQIWFPQHTVHASNWLVIDYIRRCFVMGGFEEEWDR